MQICSDFVTAMGSGFIAIQDIANGRKGYCHNLAHLWYMYRATDRYAIKHPIFFEEALKRLRKEIWTTIQKLQEHDINQVDEFVIGKSFVLEKPETTFDPSDPSLWKLGGGFTQRWQQYKREGFNGLIVIGCITDDLIPALYKNKKSAVQLYTLALEQALIHHYMFVAADASLGNRSLDCGNKYEDSDGRCGIVYIAVRFKSQVNICIYVDIAIYI